MLPPTGAKLTICAGSTATLTVALLAPFTDIAMTLPLASTTSQQPGTPMAYASAPATARCTGSALVGDTSELRERATIEFWEPDAGICVRLVTGVPTSATCVTCGNPPLCTSAVAAVASNLDTAASNASGVAALAFKLKPKSMIPALGPSFVAST